MRTTTREVFENARECIQSGHAALAAVKRHIDRHHGTNRALIFLHALVVIAVMLTIVLWIG
jgi:hypothetical protein